MPHNFNPTGCQCSEKFDGIQGRWDGRTLTTRDENIINAPQWWTARLPNAPLVGELWLGRNRFDALRSIACRNTPDERWASVRFMVFSGEASGLFAETVSQTTIESQEHFQRLYDRIVADGGEGVVVTCKSGDQFKKKPDQDDEGVLVGIIPGAGKNTGLAGALVLKNRDGRTVKLSAGLTRAMRKNPPASGSVVRFKFNGTTSTGLPRFARFDGVRAEGSLDF